MTNTKRNCCYGLTSLALLACALRRVKRYASKMTGRCPKVLFVCADRGTPYLDTVFDPTWANRLLTPDS